MSVYTINAEAVDLNRRIHHLEPVAVSGWQSLLGDFREDELMFHGNGEQLQPTDEFRNYLRTAFLTRALRNAILTEWWTQGVVPIAVSMSTSDPSDVEAYVPVWGTYSIRYRITSVGRQEFFLVWNTPRARDPGRRNVVIVFSGFGRDPGIDGIPAVPLSGVHNLKRWYDNVVEFADRANFVRAHMPTLLTWTGRVDDDTAAQATGLYMDRHPVTRRVDDTYQMSKEKMAKTMLNESRTSYRSKLDELRRQSVLELSTTGQDDQSTRRRIAQGYAGAGEIMSGPERLLPQDVRPAQYSRPDLLSREIEVHEAWTSTLRDIYLSTGLSQRISFAIEQATRNERREAALSEARLVLGTIYTWLYRIRWSRDDNMVVRALGIARRGRLDKLRGELREGEQHNRGESEIKSECSVWERTPAGLEVAITVLPPRKLLDRQALLARAVGAITDEEMVSAIRTNHGFPECEPAKDDAAEPTRQALMAGLSRIVGSAGD